MPHGLQLRADQEELLQRLVTGVYGLDASRLRLLCRLVVNHPPCTRTSNRRWGGSNLVRVLHDHWVNSCNITFDSSELVARRVDRC